MAIAVGGSFGLPAADAAGAGDANQSVKLARAGGSPHKHGGGLNTARHRFVGRATKRDGRSGSEERRQRIE
jgi:hypothetical protein